MRNWGLGEVFSDYSFICANKGIEVSLSRAISMLLQLCEHSPHLWRLLRAQVVEDEKAALFALYNLRRIEDAQMLGGGGNGMADGSCDVAHRHALPLLEFMENLEPPEVRERLQPPLERSQVHAASVEFLLS